MSGLFGCFICKKSNKKKVIHDETVNPPPTIPTQEQPLYHRASTISMTYGSGETRLESRKRNKAPKVVNKPLQQYVFPRVDSLNGNVFNQSA